MSLRAAQWSPTPTSKFSQRTRGASQKPDAKSASASPPSHSCCSRVSHLEGGVAAEVVEAAVVDPCSAQEDLCPE